MKIEDIDKVQRIKREIELLDEMLELKHIEHIEIKYRNIHGFLTDYKLYYLSIINGIRTLIQNEKEQLEKELQSLL